MGRDLRRFVLNIKDGNFNQRYNLIIFRSYKCVLRKDLNYLLFILFFLTFFAGLEASVTAVAPVSLESADTAKSELG